MVLDGFFYFIVCKRKPRRDCGRSGQVRGYNKKKYPNHVVETEPLVCAVPPSARYGDILRANPSELSLIPAGVNWDWIACCRFGLFPLVLP